MSQSIDFDKWLQSQTWIDDDICVDCSVEGRLESLDTIEQLKPVSLDKVNERTADINLSDNETKPIFKLHKLVSSEPDSAGKSKQSSMKAPEDTDALTSKRLSDEEIYRFAMEGGQNVLFECEVSR